MFSNRGNVKRSFYDETNGVQHVEYFAPNWMPTLMLASLAFNFIFIAWGASSINHQNQIIDDLKEKTCLQSTQIPLTNLKVCQE